MNVNEAYDVFNNIRREISKLEDRRGYLPDEIISEKEEDRLKANLGMRIINNLTEVKYLLDHLEKSILADGRLEKNQSTGRYFVEGHELTTGYTVEEWDEEYKEWNLSRLEHNGEDYYIASLGRNTPIENVRVRIRS